MAHTPSIYDFSSSIDGFGYKLFRLRKDRSLGPLFINRKQRIKLHTVYQAEDHPTKGYAHRPGWHICAKKSAPHLSKKGRVWCKVAFTGAVAHQRPKSQGGLWFLAEKMVVLEVCQPGITTSTKTSRRVASTSARPTSTSGSSH